MHLSDVFFQYLTTLAGIPPDHLKMLFTFVLAVPLARFYTMLPTPASRHIYGIVVSTFILTGIFSLYKGIVHVLASSLITYGLSWFLRNQGKVMPYSVFSFLMLHLTWNHINRQFWGVDPDSMEITGTQMVLVMKLSSYAWNVYDGAWEGSQQEQSEHQKRNKLEFVPDLLTFLGFVFYFPGLMVGPSMEFKDYVKFTDLSLFEGEADSNGKRARKSLDSIPNRKRTTLYRLIAGIAFFAVYGALGKKFAYHWTFDDSFAVLPFWKKFLYVQLA
eukprot:TRINITY_DN3622_c0_g1_i2.p1 TRINITY_DN3622_c0_g1~~TRINITY_DN3622_c0_g1_i2.p1  ORF type:complete len:274 (+),score=68.77 TRINITY_DN3622_c0_g1_i2:80-901(+)